MEYLYELIDLLNRYTERNIEIENKIRDLVCYLSEKPECINYIGALFLKLPKN